MYFCFINFYFDRRNQKSKGESLYRLKKSTLINIEVFLEKISAYCRKLCSYTLDRSRKCTTLQACFYIYLIKETEFYEKYDNY